MAYNANIPQPTDQLSVSQGDLLANFQAIKQLVDVNHGTFSAADEGKHKFVTMPVQGVSPVTAAAEVALFSRTSAFTTNPEIAFRRETNGAVIEFTSSLQAASGWSFLPSGILVKWGNFATIPGAQTLLFPVAATIPVFTSIFQVMITTSVIGASDTFVLLNSFTITDMTVTSTARTTTAAAVSGFRYLAIGV